MPSILNYEKLHDEKAFNPIHVETMYGSPQTMKAKSVQHFLMQ